MITAELELHKKWLAGEDGGVRLVATGADLSGADLRDAKLRGANLRDADLYNADLSGADLRDANLRGANLYNADLRDANLRGANLSGANLSDANLSGANLRDANLRDANLSDANLSDADLRGTSLDPEFHAALRAFVKECPPLKTGGRIVYRTANSLHVSNTVYTPGKTYVAPYFSMDSVTACHPRIYAASLEWMRREYSERRLVRCYVRDGDWVITSKGAIGCKRLRVLGYVD